MNYQIIAATILAAGMILSAQAYYSKPIVIAGSNGGAIIYYPRTDKLRLCPSGCVED